MSSIERKVWVRENASRLPEQSALWESRVKPNAEQRELGHRVVCYAPAEHRGAAIAEGGYTAMLEHLFQCRANLHRGETGYFFELFGKPATVDTYPTIREAAEVAYASLERKGTR